MGETTMEGLGDRFDELRDMSVAELYEWARAGAEASERILDYLQARFAGRVPGLAEPQGEEEFDLTALRIAINKLEIVRMRARCNERQIQRLSA